MSEPDWAAGLKSRLSAAIDPVRLPKEVPALRLAPEPKVEKIPVTARPISKLESIHQESFTLTEEWHTDDWDKMVAFAIQRMQYGPYTTMANDMMDEVSAEFKRIEERYPDSTADQISRQALPNALQAWAKKKLSK